MTATAHRPIQDFIKGQPQAYAAMTELGKAAAGLDKQLAELVKIRVSQLNGCAYCVQFHLNLARRIGVDAARLDQVAAWRDAAVFTPRERTALAWAEALTRPEGGVPDALREQVGAEFGEQMVPLTLAIGTINQWNRLSIGLHFAPPEPG